jgi:hypothetical protein
MSRRVAALFLASGCGLVACQAISGLGGFGLSETGSASHAAGTGSMAQGSGSQASASTASGMGGSQPAGPSSSTTATDASTGAAPDTTSTTSSSDSATSSAADTSSSSSSGTGGAAPCDNYVFVSTAVFRGDQVAGAMGVGGDLGMSFPSDQSCFFEATKSVYPAVGGKSKWAAVYAIPPASAKQHVEALLANSPIGKVCLPDGTPVAMKGTWWSNVHAGPIDQDVDGNAVNSLVWTGANPDGSTALAHCLKWTSPSSGDTGVVGDSVDTMSWANKQNAFCDLQLPVYCLSNSF